MNKIYSPINWENYPSGNTPINEDNLNKMDTAINELDNRVISQDAVKANKTELSNLIKEWVIDETTGVITLTKYNGEQVIFDLNIEKVPVSFYLDDDGILYMTTDDGTTFSANIGSMIPVLTFNSSDTIAVSVSGSGVNKTYSFAIKKASVTEDLLQPNFLADIQTEANSAELSSSNAKNYATQAQSYAVGGTGSRTGEDTDNAKYYKEQVQAMHEDYTRGQVTGVKGNNETSYRSGNVNLTADNIGAATEEDIKAIEIGGTNLLTNTNSTSAPFATSETYRGLVIRYRDNSAGTNYGDLGTQRLSDIEPNTQYTLSFYAKGSGDISSYFYPNVVASGYSNMSTDSALGDGSIRHTLTDNWTRYIITYTTKSTVEGDKDLIPVRVWQGAIAYVCGLKFEKGNKATDWSPAPSDAINRISTVESGLLEVNGKGNYLKTSILAKSNEVSAGVHNYILAGSGYTGDDLPSSIYAFGSATVYKRENGRETVIIWGMTTSATTVNPPCVNYYSRENGWTGWKTFATTTDLANYLPLTGGTVEGDLSVNGTVSTEELFVNGQAECEGITNSLGVISMSTNRYGVSVSDGAEFTPMNTAPYDLGNSTYRWNNIYASNGTIQTSDRIQKTDIVDLDNDKAQSFIMGLKPSTYKMVNGTSDRTHWGLISQDIEELMTSLDMSSLDFAGFIKSPKIEYVTTTDEKGRETVKKQIVKGEYTYSLRYDEFIAPLIKVVQKQQRQIDELNETISKLTYTEE